MLYFQWVPSHCGIPENIRADALAGSAQCQSVSTHVDRYIESHTFIHEIMRRNHPDEDVARDHNVRYLP